MKPIKLLLLLFTASVSFTARSQFFQDSLQVTGVHVIPSVSQGVNYFLRYYRDSVTYDSTNGADEFYTVEKRHVGMGGTKSKFNLRVNGGKVYLSGTVNYNYQPIILKDQIIYDYTLNIGDTLTIKLNSDTLLDIRFRLDSGRMTMFKDGVKRIMYFYTRWQGTQFGEPFFSTEGLGSSMGLVFLKADNTPVSRDKLISVCEPSRLIYGNDDCVVGGYKIVPFCNEDSIKSEMVKAGKADIKGISALSSINIYPNPASHQLTLMAKVDGFVSIMNMTGTICINKQAFVAGQAEIDIYGLQSGMYLLAIETDQGTVFRKINVINQ